MGCGISIQRHLFLHQRGFLTDLHRKVSVMYQIVRTDEQVDGLLNRAAEEFDETTSPAAEMAIRTVNWLTGATDEDPLS